MNDLVDRFEFVIVDGHTKVHVVWQGLIHSLVMSREELIKYTEMIKASKAHSEFVDFLERVLVALETDIREFETTMKLREPANA